MPTYEEFQELCNKCTSTWTTYKCVYGRKFVGPNGNSIFLPAAGSRWGTDVYYRGNYGYYWSGAIYSDGSSYAWGLGFYDGSVSPYSSFAATGFRFALSQNNRRVYLAV